MLLQMIDRAQHQKSLANMLLLLLFFYAGSSCDCGYVWDIRLKEVAALSDAAVAHASTQLRPGDRQILIDNWIAGRDCLIRGLDVKLAHFDVFPWKCFGIAATDEANIWV
jgi:hypothetical protein